MVAPYPAEAGLRRRAARLEAQGQIFPPPVAAGDQNTPEAGPTRAPQQRRVLLEPLDQPRALRPRVSRVYCLISAVLAVLAIVLSPPSSQAALRDSSDRAAHGNMDKTSLDYHEHQHGSKHQDSLHAAVGDAQEEGFFFSKLHQIFSIQDTELAPLLDDASRQSRANVPFWKRWIPVKPESHDSASEVSEGGRNRIYTWRLHLWRSQYPLVMVIRSWVDPALLSPQASTPTDIIDKILTSTPRLLAIANLLLSMTYLLHTAVADLFLGSGRDRAADETRWAGRERLGGFLVFKLLLISAVVAPDTLDLLILLSWYTLLSFLRSLTHLCAATTAHTSQSGQAPRNGVFRLLLVVLVCDAFQAAACVALFHGAGWGMVLLLTCDSALLGIDVICHILRHAAQALEERHGRHVSELEDRQLMLHRQPLQQQQQGNVEDQQENETSHDDADNDWEEVDNEWEEDELRREESRHLDRRMEIMETAHTRRLSVLDTAVFIMQLLTYLITVIHFLHIWSLHGLQFTLIDGVLALHLHSALTAAGKKITERRNLNRIARDLDGLFDDASEMDLRKASATGDVCCICLGTMSTGNVKKVGCGHLYHTHCLREVVERARSLEAAKCPLCRASVLDGRPSHNSSSAVNNNNNPNNDAPPVDAAETAQQQVLLGERALFSFSTENIIPAWLPVPAFSFEVVRRAPAAPRPAQNRQAVDPARQRAANDDEERPDADEPPPQQPQGQSFLRRLFMMSGLVSMSPEEEAIALEQLVDMFPQYERADLLRELRDRGSSEAVVEAVLMGLFIGVPRRGAVTEVVGTNANEQVEEVAAQEGTVIT